MATNVAGERSTITVNTSAHIRAVDDKVIHNLEPDVAPFTRLLKKTATASPQGNRKVEWMEDEYPVRRDVVVTGATAVATSVVMTTYMPFIKYSIWLVEETSEIIRVTTTASTTTVAIARAVGGSTGAAITAGDTLRHLGSAYTENTALQAAVSVQKTMPFNNIQDIRDAVDLSDHQINANEYGGPDLPYQIKKKLIEHMTHINNLLFFGSRGVVSSTTQYTMGGLDEFISTNDLDVSGTGFLTRQTFTDFLADVFRYGSKRKLIVGGAPFIRAVEGWGWDLQRLMPSASKIGINIATYESAFGTLGIMYDPNTLEGDTYGGYAYILDMENISMVHHKGNIGPTHLKDQTRTRTNSGELFEYRTNLTMTRKLEKTHGRIKGIEA